MRDKWGRMIWNWCLALFLVHETAGDDWKLIRHKFVGFSMKDTQSLEVGWFRNLKTFVTFYEIPLANEIDPTWSILKGKHPLLVCPRPVLSSVAVTLPWRRRFKSGLSLVCWPMSFEKRWNWEWYTRVWEFVVLVSLFFFKVYLNSNDIQSYV